MESKRPNFDYSSIPLGYYDEIALRKKGIRSFWHFLKFSRIINRFHNKDASLLDIGCFAGTFLGMIPSELVAHQLGIDILEDQIIYAKKKYETSFRNFKLYKHSIDTINIEDNLFDYITIIEVIEHLETDEIKAMINFAFKKLKPNGKLFITTPNYFSIWPIQEFLLNRISSIKYEEQHITHFNYFNIHRKLCAIEKDFNAMFTFNYKTTTHFLTPYISIISFKLANSISSFIPNSKWKFPAGSLILIEYTKNNIL
ncbi:MAG: methyltransferase domain-containing protein [Bacteroidales bacterium]|nr:methyltransferase domain-containing protein [Bacteroidales bacterium]